MIKKVRIVGKRGGPGESVKRNASVLGVEAVDDTSLLSHPTVRFIQKKTIEPLEKQFETVSCSPTLQVANISIFDRTVCVER